jgi:hypothetical protein
VPLKVRSIVGLMPMIAVAVAPGEMIGRLPNFKKRVNWFMRNRPELRLHISEINEPVAGTPPTRMLAIPSRDQLARMFATCSMKTNFSRPTASAPSRAITRTIPTS